MDAMERHSKSAAKEGTPHNAGHFSSGLSTWKKMV